MGFSRRPGSGLVGQRHQSSLAKWWRGSVGANLLEQIGCSLLIAQMETGEG
ncbi:hypothetical protein [Aliihoeflea sp. 40Bstr573]|uniref:hypothetical protein n=1 Tax=Aliihoeflea sp. 40Bstr573 TaxID=2696467 RepID=UPI00209549FB|nr:hypothetical protein [Aliihoeflea sp. 40Bstr573]